MGFGLLFVGYFCATLMSINVAGAFIRILGYGIAFIASRKLNKYNRSFEMLSWMSLLMLFVAVLLAASDVSTFLYEGLIIDNNFLGETYRAFVGYVEMALSFAFNAVMLYSIKSIAEETEVTKISIAAVRNFIFICVYYILNIFCMLPFAFSKAATKYLSAPVLILYFVWIILNLVLIASCYARICDENDVDMARKPSKFEFVNKMRAESEKRGQKASERQEEYIKQKMEKRNNRKK